MSGSYNCLIAIELQPVSEAALALGGASKKYKPAYQPLRQAETTIEAVAKLCDEVSVAC